MSFIDIFRRGPTRAEIKQLIDEVSANNQFYRSVYGQLYPGTTLSKDAKVKDYIKDGYEKNADVFALIDRLSTMFAQIPRHVVQGEEDDIVTDGELAERLRQPNSYQIWQEWAKLWYTFYLVTGNAIVYAPRIEGGNDKGKLMPGGMFIMPTQHIEIHPGGWRDPIKQYILDMDQTEKIPAEEVIHVRMPNLRYDGGANFMGMSPLKVAALIIEMENQGIQTVADTMARGMPAGIVKMKEGGDKGSAELQSEIDRAWDSKYGRQKYNRSGVRPVTGLGVDGWVPMGFSNFRDLQILEMSQHGLRVLCNVLGVPSIAFNDTAGTTFSNMNDARKMVYTNRLIPDAGLLDAYLNALVVPGYGEGIRIKSDFSDIPELQDDKKDLAGWLEVAARWGYPPADMMKKLGLEVPDDPALQRSYLPFNLVPADELGMISDPGEEEIKALEREGIDDYKGLKKAI